jgi:hypothetical protein
LFFFSKDICEATLCADLSAENAYALLELADQCEANRLRKFAAAFINKNWP